MEISRRVQEVIASLETRTEGETSVEDETAFEQGYTAIQVLAKRVSVMRQLITLMEREGRGC